jgi:hypothetical protein
MEENIWVAFMILEEDHNYAVTQHGLAHVKNPTEQG